MKGADQCPKCASRRWSDADQGVTKFYAGRLRVCGNCGTAWEPFEESALLDEGVQNSSFTEPCNNCAFRPGSHEQQDPVKWKALMDQIGLDENGRMIGQFFCHKGVPIDLEHKTPTDSGFAYPTKNGKSDPKRLRLCRGYLRMARTQLDRHFKREGDA